MSAPDTIVLIHGFWGTPRSWEQITDRALDWALANAKTTVEA